MGRHGGDRLFQRRARPGQGVRQGLDRLSQRRLVAAAPKELGDPGQRVGHVPERSGQLPGGGPDLLHGLLALEGATQSRSQVLQGREQAGHGCFPAGGRLPQRPDCRPQLPLRLFSQVRGLAGLVQDLLQLVGQIFRQVHQSGGVVQDRRQLVDEPGEPGGQVIDLVNIFIGPVRGGVREVSNGILGLRRPVRDGLHPLRDLIGGPADVVPRLVNEAPQHIQFVQQVPQLALVVEQAHLRHQLTGDAAHILPAQDRPGIGAAVQIAGLPPRDAADVVPHVGIPHRSGVDAALQDAGGKPGDAADIGADRHILRSVELFLIQIVQV